MILIQVDENKTQMRQDLSRKQVEMNIVRREGAGRVMESNKPHEHYLQSAIRGGTYESVGCYKTVINNPTLEELSLTSSLALV